MKGRRKHNNMLEIVANCSAFLYWGLVTYGWVCYVIYVSKRFVNILEPYSACKWGGVMTLGAFVYAFLIYKGMVSIFELFDKLKKH